MEAPKESFGPRRQVATIIYAGLGGAILGLSTLSFYGRPQDNLANIAIGFAVGVISGAVYTTYKAATRPPYDPNMYGMSSSHPGWGDSFADIHKRGEPQPNLTLGWSWDF